MLDVICTIRSELGKSVTIKYDGAINENQVILSTPFCYYDGDHIALFLNKTTEGYTLTDGGVLVSRILFDYFCDDLTHSVEDSYSKFIKPYCEEFQVIDDGELKIEINHLSELANSYSRLIQLMITIYAIAEEVLEETEVWYKR